MGTRNRGVYKRLIQFIVPIGGTKENPRQFDTLKDDSTMRWISEKTGDSVEEIKVAFRYGVKVGELFRLPSRTSGTSSKSGVYALWPISRGQKDTQPAITRSKRPAPAELKTATDPILLATLERIASALEGLAPLMERLVKAWDKSA